VLDQSPDERLTVLMDEADRAEGSTEVVVALYGVLKPLLLRAYERHLATTNPLVDFPTCRILHLLVDEERDHLTWGAEALAELTASPETARLADRWRKHLRRYLAAVGGLDGEAARTEALRRE
jgi:hypothetical protein